MSDSRSTDDLRAAALFAQQEAMQYEGALSAFEKIELALSLGQAFMPRSDEEELKAIKEEANLIAQTNRRAMELGLL